MTTNNNASLTIFQFARQCRHIWRETASQGTAAVMEAVKAALFPLRKRGADSWIGAAVIRPCRTYGAQYARTMGAPIAPIVVFNMAARYPLYLVAARLVWEDGYAYAMPCATWLDVVTEYQYQCLNAPDDKPAGIYIDKVHKARISAR